MRSAGLLHAVCLGLAAGAVLDGEHIRSVNNGYVSDASLLAGDAAAGQAEFRVLFASAQCKCAAPVCSCGGALAFLDCVSRAEDAGRCRSGQSFAESCVSVSTFCATPTLLCTSQNATCAVPTEPPAVTTTTEVPVVHPSALSTVLAVKEVPKAKPAMRAVASSGGQVSSPKFRKVPAVALSAQGVTMKAHSRNGTNWYDPVQMKSETCFWSVIIVAVIMLCTGACAYVRFEGKIVFIVCAMICLLDFGLHSNLIESLQKARLAPVSGWCWTLFAMLMLMVLCACGVGAEWAWEHRHKQEVGQGKDDADPYLTHKVNQQKTGTLVEAQQKARPQRCVPCC